MTFKEKLKQEYPKIADKYCGCPKHLDYEDENIYCLQMGCIECWNREMHGTEENTTNLSDDYDEFICEKCGLIINSMIKIIIDEDERILQSFEYKFCPECGRKVVD